MQDIEYPKSSKKPSLGRRAVRGGGRLGSWVFRFVMKLFLVALFIVSGLLIGGFLQFTNKVTDAVIPADIEPAEAIVALTGGSTRIATALDLLAQKKGQRLLISGVNEDTLKSDIAAMHTDKAELFECCVDVERLAVDTIGNARETATWLKANGYKSLILVTSAYHMPRSMLEFRRQMEGVQLVPYPVPLESINKEEWWKNASTLRFMVNEYLKYLGARARDYIRPQTYDALRGEMFGAKEI